MLDTMFDTLTRRTATRVSRRNSLLTLGGAGAAVLALSQSVQAKKKKKKKKNNAKNQANKKCEEQAKDCEVATLQLGFDSSKVACCEFLATCDAASYVQCLAA